MVVITDKRKELTKNLILYTLKKVKNTDGRIKLMKLMFLIEHYDIETNKIVPQKTIGNQFIIYHFGPFSFEVYEELIRLIREGKINERYFELKSNVDIKNIEKKIHKDLLKRVNIILNKFGNLSGQELEKETLKLLGIKENEKSRYFGIPVEAILLEKVLL
ncbi:MAG: type II toxin-antitoxin system antitoxin SocA domain-containing protein [Candidatus Heimdallarchaeaceae archaeon]